VTSKQDLADLFVEVGELPRSLSALFLIDEMQNLGTREIKLIHPLSS
jgi:hypothetical protein